MRLMAQSGWVRAAGRTPAKKPRVRRANMMRGLFEGLSQGLGRRWRVWAWPGRAA